MAEEKSMVGDVYYPAPEVVENAHIKSFEQVNAAATADLAGFWGKIAAENFEWFKPWETVLDDSNAPFYKWFVGAKVNIVHNALDRHMRTAVRNKAALIFEGEPGDSRVYTYQQLNHEVCKFSSVLRSMGVGKGDRVTIYMGRIPELMIAMLACAKIGAMHSVVYGGFSTEALHGRIEDSESKVLVTADGAWLRGNVVPL
ncbi:MAG: AMP-binding protein, partial [Anaerolineae bacterium]